MAKVPVAYEEKDHAACEACETCGGLAGFIESTKESLATLGSKDPAGDIAAMREYVARARATGMTPAQTANLVYAMRHGFGSKMVAEPSMASDYIAVDAQGRRVWGPGKDYVEAKHHAQMAGGVVKFHFADEARDCVGIHTHTPVDVPAVVAAAGERVSYHDRAKLPRNAFALPQRRALLLTDKHGKVTAGHVKAAAARLSMMKHEGHVNRNEHAEAHRRIVAAGKKVGIDVSEPGACPSWYSDDEPVYVGAWRKESEGYVATTDGSGKAVLSRRKPDKRHGVAPWAVHVGGVEVTSAESKSAAKKKFERCVRAVKARGDAVNPWAVCRASLNRESKSKEEPLAAGEACVRIEQRGDVDIIKRNPACSPQVGVRVDTPKHLHAFMRDRVKDLGDERFWCVGVSKQGEAVGQPIEIAVGQFDQVRVDVAKVIGTAGVLRAAGAESMTMAHAHPSGHGEYPSDMDKELTKRVRSGMNAIGMPFNGHYVLSEKQWSRC